MHVERLIWDEWNAAHIAIHHVTPDQVEQACASNNVTLEGHYGRILLIGTADDNLVTVVLHQETADDVYYVITARPSSRKERRYYRRIMAHDGEGESDAEANR